MSDPNSVTANEQQGQQTVNGANGNGLSTGAIVGVAVSCGVVVYAAATVLFVRRYQRRRAEREEQENAQYQAFAQSISAPIMQENSLGWSSSSPAAHHYYNQQDQHFQHHPYHTQW